MHYIPEANNPPSQRRLQQRPQIRLYSKSPSPPLSIRIEVSKGREGEGERERNTERAKNELCKRG